jgi:chromosome segregation ATPase
MPFNNQEPESQTVRYGEGDSSSDEGADNYDEGKEVVCHRKKCEATEIPEFAARFRKLENDVDGEIKELKAKLESKDNKIKALGTEIKILEKETAELMKKLEDKDNDIKVMEFDAGNRARAIKAKDKEIAELQRKLDAARDSEEKAEKQDSMKLVLDKLEALGTQMDKIQTIDKVSRNLKNLASWLAQSDSSLRDYIKSKTETVMTEILGKISPNPVPETAERESHDDDDFMTILESAKKRKRV